MSGISSRKALRSNSVQFYFRRVEVHHQSKGEFSKTQAGTAEQWAALSKSSLENQTSISNSVIDNLRLKSI